MFQGVHFLRFLLLFFVFHLPAVSAPPPFSLLPFAAQRAPRSRAQHDNATAAFVLLMPYARPLCVAAADDAAAMPAFCAAPLERTASRRAAPDASRPMPAPSPAPTSSERQLNDLRSGLPPHRGRRLFDAAHRCACRLFLRRPPRADAHAEVRPPRPSESRRRACRCARSPP